MKQKIFVDENLRKEVVDIYNQRKSNFEVDTESKQLSLEIVRSLSFEYYCQNPSLAVVFDKLVLPALKKMNENERLLHVKKLLTDGFIDIDNERIYLCVKPYLNYDSKAQRNVIYFVSEIRYRMRMKINLVRNIMFTDDEPLQNAARMAHLVTSTPEGSNQRARYLPYSGLYLRIRK